MSPDDRGRRAIETITRALKRPVRLPRRIAPLIAIASVLIVTACTNGNGDTLNDLTIQISVTPAPNAVTAPPVFASPTVDPALIIPPTLLGGNVGAEGFTPGALPTVSDSTGGAVTVTPTPIATQPSLSLDIQAGTLALVGRYYALAPTPAGIAILIGGTGELKGGWGALPIRLNEVGYNVLTYDQRGLGETGGTVDWSQTPADASLVLGYMHTLPNVDPRRSITIGSGLGAILAIDACAADPACQSVIAISPHRADQGLNYDSAIAKFGKRSLLVISAANSPHITDANALINAISGSHQLISVTGTSEGQALLIDHPELAATIANWLTQIALNNSKSR